ncbi:hypothetical protein GCM10007874_18920 [Labrys miyagiensis]|uniref:Uncharacterized protein n=1 Tax=Labrys miyagiensis TaxID=346912 RepID=A0ABQ6CFD4_9HYPH|nr:hypothetical protein GCM10007874_18920 [Labrys miyagiensis]
MRRNRRPPAITRQDCGRRGEAAASAVPNDGDAGRVDAKLRCMIGKPSQPRVAILDWRRVRMLGWEPVIYSEKGHATRRDVAP